MEDADLLETMPARVHQRKEQPPRSAATMRLKCCGKWEDERDADIQVLTGRRR